MKPPSPCFQSHCAADPALASHCIFLDEPPFFFVCVLEQGSCMAKLHFKGAFEGNHTMYLEGEVLYLVNGINNIPGACSPRHLYHILMLIRPFTL